MAVSYQYTSAQQVWNNLDFAEDPASCVDIPVRAGEDVVPHLNSHVSATKVSVKLPSMNTDNQARSMSSIQGDSDSSGTDTF